MAQLGRALRSGRRGRRFKSCHADALKRVLEEELFFLLFFLAFFNERATIKQSDTFDQGLVAQLGERCVRNAEVEGSNPFRSMEQKFYKYGSIAQLG